MYGEDMDVATVVHEGVYGWNGDLVRGASEVCNQHGPVAHRSCGRPFFGWMNGYTGQLDTRPKALRKDGEHGNLPKPYPVEPAKKS